MPPLPRSCALGSQWSGGTRKRFVRKQRRAVARRTRALLARMRCAATWPSRLRSWLPPGARSRRFSAARPLLATLPFLRRTASRRRRRRRRTLRLPPSCTRCDPLEMRVGAQTAPDHPPLLFRRSRSRSSLSARATARCWPTCAPRCGSSSWSARRATQRCSRKPRCSRACAAVPALTTRHPRCTTHQPAAGRASRRCCHRRPRLHRLRRQQAHLRASAALLNATSEA